MRRLLENNLNIATLQTTRNRNIIPEDAAVLQRKGRSGKVFRFFRRTHFSSSTDMISPAFC